MANAIKTVMTYPLNGSTRDFNIPFEYLARKFITVTLIGKDRKVLVLNQDYRFSTKTTLTTTRAWAVADGYTSIEVRRFTSATDRLVDFADGSILRAYDLNISQVQTLHVAEEARDLTADTIGVNNEGNLDSRGRRIVNVANAVDRGDAINYGQVLDMSNGAYQSGQFALQQAQEATRQRQASDASAAASQNSRVASDASAAASQNSRLASEAALTSANAARDLAQKWANNPEDSVVANGMFSAYHWAFKAASSAASALGFRDTAKTYMDSASASAATATSQADRAKTEADKLANFNGLAGALDNVSGTNVTWKGTNYFPAIELSSNTPFIDFHFANSTADFTSRLFADSATSLKVTNSFSITNNLGVSGAGTISGGLVVGGDSQFKAKVSTLGRLSANEIVEARGFYTFDRAADATNRQGTHIVWNETASQGESAFINNRGNGTGGFNFRTVNLANDTQTGAVSFSGTGEVTASGSITSRGTIYSAGDVWAGQSHMGTDGNIYNAGAWGGGDLRNWILGNSMGDAGRGGQQYRAGAIGSVWEAPGGCFLTGINTNVSDGRAMGVYFRQLIGRKISGAQFGLGDF